MMIRFFRIFFSLLRVYPYRNIQPWSEEDAKSLNGYLSSPSGRKLAVHLQNESIRINASAVQSGSLAQCGQAHGFMYCCSYLQNLSALPVPQTGEIDEDSEEGAAEFFERMAP